MRNNVAAFGEVMMRLQVPGHELLAQAGSLRYTFSGTGVNVVSALSRFGHCAYLVTTLPDNPLGDAAEAYLRKLGIHDAYIRRDGKYIGMYFLENGFGARPSRVTYTNRLESSFNMAPTDAYDFEAIAAQVDVAHFCGITLAMNDAVREQMAAFAAAVRGRGGLVVFDCNYRPSLWGEDGYAKAKPLYERMLGLADIVLMNETDAIRTLGMPTGKADRREQLEELIPEVARTYGISAIAGTHRWVLGNNTNGLQGFLFRSGGNGRRGETGGQGERDASGESSESGKSGGMGGFAYSRRLEFPVYDRIGAGDAFASGIVHGELSGWTPERTVEFAANAGMLAHSISGDTPMSSERDVLRAMETSASDVER